MITPKRAYIEFESKDKKIEILKQLRLLSKGAKKLKDNYLYKGVYKKEPTLCDIAGYVDENEIIIKIIETDELHSIHPSYLKQMQAKNFKIRACEESED